MESKIEAKEVWMQVSNGFAQGRKKQEFGVQKEQKSDTKFHVNRHRNESQQDHYIITIQGFKF